MFTVLIVLSVLAGVAYRITTPAERQRLVQKLGPAIAVVERWITEAAAFHHSLDSRPRWLIVTPGLVVLNVVVFTQMLLGDSSLGEPTLLAWGATQGTRTAAGEWWRLATATFVNAGFWQLLITVVALVQISVILERLIGPLTVGCAYVAAGALGHTVRMSSDVTDVTFGASAAIFGLYGVLFAASTWALLRRSAMTIPLAHYKLLAPVAAVFVLFSLLNDGTDFTHNVAGFTAGLIIGLSGAMKAFHMKATFGPVACATTVAIAAIAYVAVPVQSLIGLRTQLAQLVVIEAGTADQYRQVLRKFTDSQRRLDAHKLTAVIDESIVPELSRAATDLAAIKDVTPETQPLVWSAKEYLRLREASWRLRSEGLRKGSIRLLQQADSMEQSSMEALRPIKDLHSDASN